MPYSTDKSVAVIPSESTWSLVALVITFILFVGNLAYQYKVGLSDDDTVHAMKQQERKLKLAGSIGFTQVFYDELIALAKLTIAKQRELLGVSSTWQSEHPIPANDPTKFSAITDTKEFKGVGSVRFA
eukprot:SAG31_NODE_150_length_22290_cov_5.975801_6_plen_128_part_00